MSYTYTDSNATNIVEHAEHIFEHWNAYLADELPANVSRDATGICCHSCELVIVDVPLRDEYAAAYDVAAAHARTVSDDAVLDTLRELVKIDERLSQTQRTATLDAIANEQHERAGRGVSQLRTLGGAR